MFVTTLISQRRSLPESSDSRLNWNRHFLMEIYLRSLPILFYQSTSAKHWCFSMLICRWGCDGYSGDYYLENVRLSKQTRSKCLGEDSMKYSVILPIRVVMNLDDSVVFYGELKDRWRTADEEAILEVTGVMKVVYRPSDAYQFAVASIQDGVWALWWKSTLCFTLGRLLFSVRCIRLVGRIRIIMAAPVEAWADG